REVVDHQRFQRPAHPAPGELGPLRYCCRGVLAPVVAAVIAPVAAYPDLQRGGPVTERLMRHRPCDRAARSRACSAAHAPRVRIGQAAFEHSPLRWKALTDGDQAELVQAGEGRKVT